MFYSRIIPGINVHLPRKHQVGENHPSELHNYCRQQRDGAVRLSVLCVGLLDVAVLEPQQRIDVLVDFPMAIAADQLLPESHLVVFGGHFLLLLVQPGIGLDIVCRCLLGE